MVSEEVLVFDNLAGTIRLIVNADPALDHALELAQERLAVVGSAPARAHASTAGSGIGGGGQRGAGAAGTI